MFGVIIRLLQAYNIRLISSKKNSLLWLSDYQSDPWYSNIRYPERAVNKCVLAKSHEASWHNLEDVHSWSPTDWRTDGTHASHNQCSAMNSHKPCPDGLGGEVTKHWVSNELRNQPINRVCPVCTWDGSNASLPTIICHEQGYQVLHSL